MGRNIGQTKFLTYTPINLSDRQQSSIVCLLFKIIYNVDWWIIAIRDHIHTQLPSI